MLGRQSRGKGEHYFFGLAVSEPSGDRADHRLPVLGWPEIDQLDDSVIPIDARSEVGRGQE